MKGRDSKPGLGMVKEKSVQREVADFRSRIARAQRYELGTFIRYRIRGEKKWREGMMKNISISGVLIHGDHSVPPDTAIEMRFCLPIHLHGESAAEVLCRGSVVRSSAFGGAGETAIVAARINHSRFLRQKDAKEESPKVVPLETFLKFE